MPSVRIFNDANNFRKSLEMRLLNLAHSSGQDLQRLRKQVVFERFLARLFANPISPWILKGGHAMELRMESARATQDIDLSLKAGRVSVKPQLILEHLQMAMSEKLNDFFEYRIGEAQLELDGPPYGGFRFPVESRLAERAFERFHLDVGCGDICLEPFDLLIGKGWLDFCGIPKPVFTTISCEQQCAEKIHAYTLPREGGFNSRVKDLVDIILLIRLKDFNSERFRQALDMTFTRRNTHPLPHLLAKPPQAWESTFKILASRCGLNPSMDLAFADMSTFYEKALVAHV